MAHVAPFTPLETALHWPAHVRRASGHTPARRGQKVRARPTPADQQRRHWLGTFAELAAAGRLLICGYRIIERRHRGRCGEIDLIAARGRRLAFVEVKYRRTLAEAAAAIAGVQISRIAEAAEQWVWRHPHYHNHEIGLDAILVAPGRLPHHVANALQPSA